MPAEPAIDVRRLMQAVVELVHQMAVVPLLFIGWLRLRGQYREPQWIWLAGAFFISWAADTAAHWVNPDPVGNLYPITQAAIVGMVLLDRDDAALLVCVLFFAGVVSIGWEGAMGRGIFLATVANGAAAGIAWRYKAIGRVRLALLVSFGVVGLCWWALAGWPNWPTWLAYQGVRALGIGLFCWAALEPAPHLKVLRRAA